MRPPSEPKINTDNPDMYFIYFNIDVPEPLWHKYPRKRIRLKFYDDINRYQDEEREDIAEFKRKEWSHKLTTLKYNPFEDELAELKAAGELKQDIITEIKSTEAKLKKALELPEEDKRKLVSIQTAFDAFIKSRKDRKLAPESISAYQGAIDWLTEGLREQGYLDMAINKIKHIHISAALNYISEDREWVATTINKAIDFAMSVFNWLATEDYMDKNPSKGKFIKLPTNKSKHRWYDKDTKKSVIGAITKANNIPLLRACQFTYWLMIRSKKELRLLKVGDIDRTLKRIRFRADVSKNNEEVYRDYPEEFEVILNEMQLERFPNHYFVFGSKDGSPGIAMCGHNYFSRMFMAVKEKLSLSMDYTVYGFKHTRIVHELMKETDGYMISYMARHNDRKSTKEYQRDYDITLKNKYGPEDLTF